jgi:magnesium-transporting ATPase (P-type)
MNVSIGTVQERDSCCGDVELGKSKPLGLTSKAAHVLFKLHGPNNRAQEALMVNDSYAKFAFVMELILTVASTLSFINFFVLNSSITVEQIKDYQKIVLGAVLFTMAAISFVVRKQQERNAERLSRSLMNLSPITTSVYRDGILTSLNASDIVPGDVVRIQAGDCVPADVKVLCSSELVINSKDITGERYNRPFKVGDETVLYTGIYIDNGQADCLVVATGSRTAGYANEVASHQEIRGKRNKASVPLRVEVERLVRTVSIGSVAIGIPVCVWAYFDGFPDQTCLSLFIAVVIANVPISLLPQISISFSILAKRLTKKNIYVSRIDIMDTFSSIDVLCIDKTGTLTEPKLELSSIFFDNQLWDPSQHTSLRQQGQQGQQGQGGEIPSSVAPIAELMQIICLARAEKDVVDETILGDSTTASGGGDADDRQSSTDLETRSMLGMRVDEIEDALSRCVERVHPDAFAALMRTKNLTAFHSIPFRSAAGVCGTFYKISTASPRPQDSVEEEEEEEEQDEAGNFSGGATSKRQGEGGGERGEVSWPVLLSKIHPLREESGADSASASASNMEAASPPRPPPPPPTHFLIIKGAPELVLRACSHVALSGGRVEVLSPALLQSIRDGNKTCAQRGERVIAKAMISSSNAALMAEAASASSSLSLPVLLKHFKLRLTFLGLLGFTEKIRDNAVSAIQTLKRGGIKVFLITGDHPLNSQYIARKAGVLTRPTHSELHARGLTPPPGRQSRSSVIAGHDLQDFTSEDWDALLAQDEIVFSHMLPHLKEKVVLELKRTGKIVAMLGDGVNDAPALKNAHIPISVGSGVSLAKEAAHVLLLDDDMRGLCTCVEEGRNLVWNLKKSVVYLLSSNIPELLPIILICSLGSPRCLDTVAMLVVELIINVVPGICLSYEEPEELMMLRKPDHKGFILYSDIAFAYLVGLLQTGAAFHVFLQIFERYGIRPAMLINAGPHFRDEYGVLNAERQAFFSRLCLAQEGAPFVKSDGITCDNNKFQDFRVKVLSEAQAGYFLIFVISQVANCISVRTRLRSVVFDRTRLLSNTRLYVALFFGVLAGIFIVLVPFVNDALFFSPPPAVSVCSGLWIVPVILCWEEARKILSRWTKPL